MKIFLLFICFLIMGSVAHAATTYTEFYADNVNGDNRNAGDGTALISDVGGSWDSVTSSYTASGGTPFSTATAGQFVAIFKTGQSSTSFVAQIASVGGGGSYLIVYSTRQGGTIPTTGSGFSARTGGVWQGPTNVGLGAGTFVPFNLITSSMGTQGNPVCANFKNNQIYTSTTAIVHLVTTPVRFEGYTNTPHDGGYAVFNGSNTAGFTLISIGGSQYTFSNFVFDGLRITGGSTVLVAFNGAGGLDIIRNIVIRNTRGSALTGNAPAVNYNNVECYNNNISNTASIGVWGVQGTGRVNNLYIHDSPNSNTQGIRVTFTQVQNYENTIISNIGSSCIFSNGGGIADIAMEFDGFEFYKCGGDGAFLNINGIAQLVFRNGNFVQNGGYVINSSANIIPVKVVLDHVGYYQNTSGISNTTPLTTIYEDNTFNYNSMPYVNPAIGDFRIKSSQSLGQGDGGYLVTGSTFTALKNYINIGATQSKVFPGGAYSFSN